jgi:hypothetical protein
MLTAVQNIHAGMNGFTCAAVASLSRNMSHPAGMLLSAITTDADPSPAALLPPPLQAAAAAQLYQQQQQQQHSAGGLGLPGSRAPGSSRAISSTGGLPLTAAAAAAAEPAPALLQLA